MFPARTIGPTSMVAMWFWLRPSSSSNVTTNRLLWDRAHWTYPARFSRAHVSPAETGQSCMSWHVSGTTTPTVGSAA